MCNELYLLQRVELSGNKLCAMCFSTRHVLQQGEKPKPLALEVEKERADQKENKKKRKSILYLHAHALAHACTHARAHTPLAIHLD